MNQVFILLFDKMCVGTRLNKGKIIHICRPILYIYNIIVDKNAFCCTIFTMDPIWLHNRINKIQLARDPCHKINVGNKKDNEYHISNRLITLKLNIQCDLCAFHILYTDMYAAWGLIIFDKKKQNNEKFKMQQQTNNDILKYDAFPLC